MAKHIVKIVVSSVVTLILISCLVSGMMFGAAWNFGKFIMDGISDNGIFFPWDDDSTYQIGSGETEDDYVSKIDIDWANGDITIKKDPDIEKIQITEFYDEKLELSEENKMRFKVENSELKVRYRMSGLWFNFSEAIEKNLVISIPENYIRYIINIDAANSDINIELPELKKMDVDIANGTVILKSDSVDEFNCDMANGDINVKADVKTIDIDGANVNLSFAGKIREFDLDSAVADLDILCHDAPESIEVDCTTCIMDITFPENIRGYKIKTESISGNINVDGGTSGSKKVSFGDEYSEVEIDGVTVDVYVHFINAEEQ